MASTIVLNIKADQPKLFIIVIWFCWTIYTLLCMISFCASVHQANATLPHCVVKNTSKVVPIIVRGSFLSVRIHGEYTIASLKHRVNELSDIKLYDQICPHCTLHMMN